MATVTETDQGHKVDDLVDQLVAEFPPKEVNAAVSSSGPSSIGAWRGCTSRWARVGSG